MIYGCIGEHLSHSFSKVIHSNLMEYDYVLREIAPKDLDEFLTKMDFCGINVTIPYKQDVIPYLDDISDIAKRIGAVNTIVNKNGKLFGTNTDYYGMIALIKKADIDINNKKVLILGNGGTSKTARVVATDLGAKDIYVVSRTKSNSCITYSEATDFHSDADVVINTTPVGMYPNIDASPIDLSGFPKLSGVVDVIYNPLRTNLTLQAEKLGIKSINGLYMLVHQAAVAEEFFLNTKIGEEKINNYYSKLVKEKANIVLSGMPGCGKSTLGKLIANKLSMNFVDTDELIVEKCQTSIKNIFDELGEVGFRKIETDVIKSLETVSGTVISIGGGAILKDENVESLKHNGKIFYLNRPIEQLVATSDRPLSSDRDALIARYNERKDIYNSTADQVVYIDGSIEENLKAVLEKIVGKFW